MICHSGDRQDLLAVAAEQEYERIRRQRDAAPIGDLRAAVQVPLDHYAEFGDTMLRLLADEHRVPRLREVAAKGRVYHAK